MSINGISMVVGATGASVTGGSAVTMKDDSSDIPNGIHVVDTSITTMALRPHSTFKSKAASYANGIPVKGKREITHVRPKTLADGTYAYPLFRISFELDPEFTAAELLELQMQAVQHIIDTEASDFFTYGTTRT